ncbi:hypothetical protein IC235_11690 [Hymenobacter sp. BT664]|uniref:Uncharacterized protein n=1 Tax=Hymenobacter montanus TaxID=2771359 RepID=A0A927GJV9_9BACT|nr:hypothetical protein [Hymenobacter montanus]MBD2768549.1 hypothetical protein [Hymenobacter montanus]
MSQANMQALLRLKAWQLFLLLFGVPMVLQAVVISALFTESEILDPWAVVGLLFVAFLTLGLLLVWVYALGSHLYRRLPATTVMSLTRFRIAVVLPVAYVFLLLLYAGNVFREGSQVSVNGFITLFVLLHLSSMACLFYCLYFTAKALKTVERNAPVPVSEYLGEFFLLWFFPVGIWVLQPRVNRLFAAPPSQTPG